MGETKKLISDDVWTRTHRVFAYDAPRRARYPALTRNQAGQLVLLFTHVTKDQESAGVGDVMAIRSGDEGETWLDPTKVYEAKAGQPRTMGTLTRLVSGKLVAAVAEVSSEDKSQLVRLLTSENGGQSWQSTAALEFPSACSEPARTGG